jgi:tetratricopeptide (TPR) repeat protein
MTRWSDAVAKSKNPGAMLRLAEFAWANGEKATAETALADAEKLVAKTAPLTWRLTRAQTMWAMGRYPEALVDQQAVLDGLKARGVKPSPALLAASARLAQRAGKPAKAVDFELAAISAEQPYMPKRINVHLFRQRYQWLWGQLSSRVNARVQDAKARPADADAKRALTAALDQAVEVWRTWSRVDTANSANLHQQLAALYRSAGDETEAWRVVSTIIDRKPKDGASYYHVGQWYRGGGNSDVAQQWYGKAYQVEPTNGDWIWHRAELLRNMGQTDQARKLYQEIATKKWQPRFQHYNNRAKKRLK